MNIQDEIEENSSHPWYKARLVVKCFDKRKGRDFEKTFFPMAVISFIWVVLGLAASLNLEVEHLDVNITILHGD